MIEKRGRIHDIVKLSVQEHFSCMQYSAADIIEWVKWFCGTHGSPVFYETPVPQDGVWKTNDPDYKVSCFHFLFLFTCAYHIFEKPCGFLRNMLLVNVAMNFLLEIKKTAFNFGWPRSLFILILTAVSNQSCALFKF